MSRREAKILDILRKLEKLKLEGLISEEEYRARKDKLIEALLQEGGYVDYESSVEEKPPQRSRIFIISIIFLVCGLLFLGIAGYYFFLSPKPQPSTTTISFIIPTTVTQIATTTRTITHEIVQTATSATSLYVYQNRTIHPAYPTSRTIVSGSFVPFTLEKDCSSRLFSVQAGKGDIIRVYWESNDRHTYVAIGSDADIERNRQYYCEVMIAFWKTSWPVADYGYSGSLEFTVPSSGTWYVIVANGNYECVFTNCPITITRLEITQISG
jgi:uncharacterized membrane protein (DUF485 family)